MQLVEIFRANIVDVGAESIGIECTGDPDKIDSLVALLRPFGVREVIRTGRVAMPRSALQAGGRDGFNVRTNVQPDHWVPTGTGTGSV
jgi:hypothetical protein